MLKKLYLFSLVLLFVAGTQLVIPHSFPEVLYYTFDEAGSDSTQNFADPGSGNGWAQLMGSLSMGDTGEFGSALVGAGNLFPERMVYLYFLFPIKVKYFISFLFVMAFFSAFGSSGTGIDHFAHLGGGLFAFLYLRTE